MAYTMDDEARRFRVRLAQLGSEAERVALTDADIAYGRAVRARKRAWLAHNTTASDAEYERTHAAYHAAVAAEREAYQARELLMGGVR